MWGSRSMASREPHFLGGLVLGGLVLGGFGVCVAAVALAQADTWAEAVSLLRIVVRLGARAHLAQFREHASLLLGSGLLALLLLLFRHDDLNVGLRA
jgi:hypothetical protein